MENKEKSSDERLKELKYKRQQSQTEYEAIKKRNNEIAEYMFSKKDYLDRMLDDESVNSDPDMRAFYEEKLSRLKQLNDSEQEFQNSLEKRYRQVNEEIDEEEAAILREMEETDDFDKNKSAEEDTEKREES